jgi:hypothetical protein
MNGKFCWLWTEQMVAPYEKCGFKCIETMNFTGKQITIMRKDCETKSIQVDH